jgi:hypothetical protein
MAASGAFCVGITALFCGQIAFFAHGTVLAYLLMW